MRLSSPSFAPGAPIPRRHTADGSNASPPLHWSDLPPRTAELVVACEDPDAPGERPWIHWLVYGVRPHAAGLPEGLPRGRRELSEPGGLRQGWNDFGAVGWGGPDPPPNDPPHRYRFRLLALDARLGLAGGLRHDRLWAACAGHILAEAELVGLYGRH
jgi:Raf kinase inhibitor-like YbhB/YbcL family protein